MQWHVEGADRGTGQDKAFLITADTEGEARAIGEAQDMYVASVAPYYDDAAAPSPATPGPGQVEARQQHRPAPAAGREARLDYAGPDGEAPDSYRDVPGAARRLRAADLVLSIFGWLYIVSGGLGGVLVFVLAVRGGGIDLSVIITILYTLAAAAFGVLLLGVGAALRMLASIGTAVVEIKARDYA